jgi:periplasmic protein TonB
MNIAQARPRTWTPHIILFSIVFHVIVLYAIAVSFNIVPPPISPTKEPPTITMYRFDPVAPKIQEPDRIQKKPIFQQRPTPTPQVPTVSPSPFTATPTPVSEGPRAVDVRQPIGESPVSKILPRYPRTAQAREVEGRVVLSITIMPDGSVRDVRVVSAQPRGYFEDAAVRAVQQWRYRTSNVVRTNVVVQVDFELRDS